MQDSKQNIFYKYRNQNPTSIAATNSKGTVQQNLAFTDQYEKIVYETIESSSNFGIWIRDIRLRTSLNPTILKKVIDALVQKKYIKLINSVSATTKKLYMLYNLEPDQSISGGTFYTNQQLDHTLVDALLLHTNQLLQSKKYNEISRVSALPNQLPMTSMISISIEEVRNHMNEMKITAKILKNEDIKQILDVLVLDGKAGCIQRADSDLYYSRESESKHGTGAVQDYPCLYCPVSDDCKPNGVINPITCKYLAEWMDV
ncbi:MAG: DNA-directed RNA polymerase III subunit RPC6 [Marteilia pararefringens]